MLGLATILAISPRVVMPTMARRTIGRVNDIVLRFAETPATFATEWAELEADGAGTLFQSFRWVDAWCRTVAPVRNEHPLIVAGYGANGGVEFILPLGVRRAKGLSVLGWLGQEHAGYNMGLYADRGRRLPRGEALAELLRAIAASDPAIGLIHLAGQPAHWGGAENPLSSLASQPAANSAFVLPMDGTFEAVYEQSVSKSTRTALKRKQKKLTEHDGFTIDEAATADERLRRLDIYFRQKARQLAAMGATDPFADPAIKAFYRDLCGAGGREPVHQSLVARIGEQVLATANGISHRGRFYLLTASLDDVGELGKFSPGTVLFLEQVRRQIAAGSTVYDFGAGDGRHKSMWSPQRLELFETFMPTSAAGWAHSTLRSSHSYAKRVVKNNPVLFDMARKVRRLVSGGRQPEPALSPQHGE